MYFMKKLYKERIFILFLMKKEDNFLSCFNGKTQAQKESIKNNIEKHKYCISR